MIFLNYKEIINKKKENWFLCSAFVRRLQLPEKIVRFQTRKKESKKVILKKVVRGVATEAAPGKLRMDQ